MEDSPKTVIELLTLLVTFVGTADIPCQTGLTNFKERKIEG